MLTLQDKKRIKEGRLGLRARIDLACKDCQYDPQGKGTWRQQTEACNVEVCPLWAVRPRSASMSERMP